jgi:hypothetical protein
MRTEMTTLAISAVLLIGECALAGTLDQQPFRDWPVEVTPQHRPGTGLSHPGFSRGPGMVRRGDSEIRVCMLAASTAHVAHESGHQLVSSESCTLLREHWHTPLGHVELQLDEFFCSCVNYVFLHHRKTGIEDQCTIVTGSKGKQAARRCPSVPSCLTCPDEL